MGLRGPGEIAEDEASEALAATYARLRAALGVNFVPTLYRMLAVWEPYLTAATDALAGLLASDEAERLAVEAHARAGEAVAGLRESPAIPLGPAGDEAIAILDRYKRANPRNLLFAQALLPTAPSAPGEVMGPPEHPPPQTDDPGPLLADILECHGGVVRPGMWRELAETPHVLGPMWRAARWFGGEESFQRARTAIAELAREAAGGIAAPDPRAHGLGADEVREVEATLIRFVRLITAMIVEIEYLRRIVRP